MVIRITQERARESRKEKYLPYEKCEILDEITDDKEKEKLLESFSEKEFYTIGESHRNDKHITVGKPIIFKYRNSFGFLYANPPRAIDGKSLFCKDRDVEKDLEGVEETEKNETIQLIERVDTSLENLALRTFNLETLLVEIEACAFEDVPFFLNARKEIFKEPKSEEEFKKRSEENELLLNVLGDYTKDSLNCIKKRYIKLAKAQEDTSLNILGLQEYKKLAEAIEELCRIQNEDGQDMDDKLIETEKESNVKVEESESKNGKSVCRQTETTFYDGIVIETKVVKDKNFLNSYKVETRRDKNGEIIFRETTVITPDGPIIKTEENGKTSYLYKTDSGKQGIVDAKCKFKFNEEGKQDIEEFSALAEDREGFSYLEHIPEKDSPCFANNEYDEEMADIYRAVESYYTPEIRFEKTIQRIMSNGNNQNSEASNQNQEFESQQ